MRVRTFHDRPLAMFKVSEATGGWHSKSTQEETSEMVADLHYVVMIMVLSAVVLRR